MSRGLKVLYVDDEPDIREVAVMALELDDAIEVESASSGPRAIDLIESGAFVPDAILLDVMMPGMDGPATLAELRARGRDMPVIFITARAQSHELARFLELGAVGVITKPFDPMTLALELRAVLARVDR
ncbi:MAG TPA: response regulator [Caulobacteraceae bacterium]|nr:response regulator [Caulobacteraceae bacterium]